MLFGGVMVLRGKQSGIDTVVSILVFRKVLEVHHMFCGCVHNIANFEKDLLKIQKVFRFFNISQENRDQPEHKDKNWPHSG